VEVEVVLVPVVAAKLLGEFGRAVADGHELHAEHVELVRLLRSEEVGDAKPAAAFLARKLESQPLARRTVRRDRALSFGGERLELLGVVDDQVVASLWTGK
jgi:hypothetical protein